MNDKARRIHSGAFSNTNGISFGITDGRVTASYTVPSTTAALTAIKVSAGAASNLLSAITFSNSNGLAFGLAGSVITGSYTVPGGGGQMSFSAGTSTGTLASMVFSNASGVSWGLSGSTMTASVKTDYLTAVAVSAGTQASSTFQTLSMSNANGVSWSTAAGGLVASVNTSYRASNDAVGLNTALTANGVAWTVNSSGISLNVPAFLTTARASTDAVGLNTSKTNVTWTVNSSGISLDAGGYAGTGFTSATTAGTNIVGTQNTAGLSLGVPAMLTTAMLSNAVTLSNINISAGTTNSNASAFSFADGQVNSFSMSGNTITVYHSITLMALGNTTISSSGVARPFSMIVSGMGGISIAIPPAGAGAGGIGVSGPIVGTLSALDPIFGSSLITTAGLGQNSLYFQNFDVPHHLSAYRVNFFHSIGTTLQASNSTQSAGYTFSAAIYTLGTGASTERISTYWSGSWFINMNGSSNTQLKVTHPFGISNSTAVSTTSNGTTASSNASTYLLNSVGGFRAVPMPISLTLTPGRYWMAVANSSNSSNAIGVIGNTVMQQTNGNNVAFRPFGVSSAASNASFYGIEPGNGTYSATSGAFPGSVALTTDAIRAAPTLTMPYFNFSALTEGTNVL